MKKINIFLSILFGLLVLVSCRKYDGINAARLDSVTILSTSNADNLIQRGESSVRVSLKGQWIISKLSYGDIEVSDPTNYYIGYNPLSSAEVFTENEIIINLNFSNATRTGSYKIYVCDGDSETSYDSNSKTITVY